MFVLVTGWIFCIRAQIDKRRVIASAGRMAKKLPPYISEQTNYSMSYLRRTHHRLNEEHLKSHSEILNLVQKLNRTVRTLSSLSNLYKHSDVAYKGRLIGSIFLNKLVFEKNSVRTVELNPFVELIFSNLKGSRRQKKKSTPISVCLPVEWSRRC
jgi:hypothetical protein